MQTAPANSRPSTTTTLPVAGIIAISAVATLFLFWLIYVHPAADTTATHYTFLPNLNALLNGLSALALLIGFYFIKQRRIAAHRASMMTAFVFSSLFLVSYIANHALHGDQRYPVHDTIYHIYIPLLISHIILAIVALPVVLITFYLSLSGRIPAHRRLARITFPLWLYVSVTGVIVRIMLVAAIGRSNERRIGPSHPTRADPKASRRAERTASPRIPLKSRSTAPSLGSSPRHPFRTTEPISSSKWGGWTLATGIFFALLTKFALGGIGPQGPHTNSGWMALIVTMMCLPFGFLLFLLGALKWLRNRRLQR